jgi:hypothetical protein
MNERDVRLNRLFDAARLAQATGEPDSMPLHLKRRVLTQWRADARDERGRNMLLMFRGAFACAAMVMLAAIAWSFADLTNDPESDVAIANYELRADVMP